MNEAQREALILGAERYIDSLGTTLYGRAWDVTQPKARRQCAEHLVDELEQVIRNSVLDHYKEMLEEALGIPSSNGHESVTFIAPKNR